jgi:hypothetical protein
VFQKLVSHNPDLQRLVERGYAVAFDSNCLVVRDIPYLNVDGELNIGAFVAKLVYVDENRVCQDDHQVYFAGSTPYNLDGTPVENLAGGPTTIALSPACADVVVERSFSNKPRATGCFVDFFEKIESYVAIISGPAIAKYPEADPLTYRVVDELDPDPIFKFRDTLTSRAEIAELSAKFNDDVVAVIGLGGTGSYLLDFLVKTPVREIRAFDRDPYHVHNAFRSPGRLNADELGQTKAEVYQGRYHNFRHGLNVVPRYIDASSESDLSGVTFAFVCVDKGPSRSGIFELLIAMNIPFIDVGMGLKKRIDGGLTGMARATYYSEADAPRTRDMELAELTERPADLYRTNIQISELNSLNACMAVIRYKQIRGFYSGVHPYYHLLFDVVDFKIVGDYEANEN